jgi:flagellar hook-basal body complex protein FliE
VPNSLFSAFTPISGVSINAINNPFRSNPADVMAGTKLGPAFRTQIEEGDPASQVSFKNVIADTLQGVNQTLGAPDELMQQAMSGAPGVDIHDVMVANAKADLAINVATQVTTKIIQAYDRLLQIQI